MRLLPSRPVPSLPVLARVAVPLILASQPATAGPSPAVVRQLMMLSPATRIEQRCNGRASGAIRREMKGFSPDEVVTYAYSQPEPLADGLIARGAAFRSHGAWYRLSYECRTTDDGLAIASFNYTVGTKIPREDWDAHYLVP